MKMIDPSLLIAAAPRLSDRAKRLVIEAIKADMKKPPEPA